MDFNYFFSVNSSLSLATQIQKDAWPNNISQYENSEFKETLHGLFWESEGIFFNFYVFLSTKAHKYQFIT